MTRPYQVWNSLTAGMAAPSLALKNSEYCWSSYVGPTPEAVRSDFAFVRKAVS